MLKVMSCGKWRMPDGKKLNRKGDVMAKGVVISQYIDGQWVELIKVSLGTEDPGEVSQRIDALASTVRLSAGPVQFLDENVHVVFSQSFGPVIVKEVDL